MSTVIQGYNGAGKNSLLLKGAPERVIEKCVDYKLADGTIKKFSENDKRQLIAQIQTQAKQGLRILGLGIAFDGGKLSDLTKANSKQKLSDLS